MVANHSASVRFLAMIQMTEGDGMFFLGRKARITEQKVQDIVQALEQAYTAKDIDVLTNMFHPDKRQISFLNHFQLMMNFQIYNIKSEIMDMEILMLTGEEAAFTYTRKHIYTCVNPADENGETLSNITSYYVKIAVDKKSVYITRYSPYSVLQLGKDGEILPGEQAVVPAGAQFFEKMQRFINEFDLTGFKSATYLQYNDSEMIGYYPEAQRYRYETLEQFTVDYFEKMQAASIKEHTETYLEQDILEQGEMLALEPDYSIIEAQFTKNSCFQHELVLSMAASDGFYMIRYLKNDDRPIDPEARHRWIEQMKSASAKIRIEQP